MLKIKNCSLWKVDTVVRTHSYIGGIPGVAFKDNNLAFHKELNKGNYETNHWSNNHNSNHSVGVLDAVEGDVKKEKVYFKLKQYLASKLLRDLSSAVIQIICEHSFKSHGLGYKCYKCDFYTGTNEFLNKLIKGINP